MPCYRPLHGYRSKDRNTSGKRSIVFNPGQGFRDLPVELPCGQCIGCRLERSRQWAIRCVHESQQWDKNCFLTLTYAPEYLPPDGSLVVEHFQKFMKRLRKAFGGHKIKYFHCGEYGEDGGRPHYHAALFNFDFVDKQHYFTSRNGDDLFTSPQLGTLLDSSGKPYSSRWYTGRDGKEHKTLWPFGISTIGSLTFESAAYVARYITKKITGRRATYAYVVRFDEQTGEYIERKPEYATMSRREPIGKGWFQKYSKDVFPFDFVVLRGKKLKPPRAYTTWLENTDKAMHGQVIAARKVGASAHEANNTVDRLEVRRICQEHKLIRLKRSFENEKS